MRVGNAAVVFHQEKAASYVDSDLIDLALGPPTDYEMEAGTSQTMPLTLVNFSGRVERFEIDVRIIAPEVNTSGWWRMVSPDGTTPRPGELPQVRLDTAVAPAPQPRATARLNLLLMPPRRPEVSAGKQDGRNMVMMLNPIRKPKTKPAAQVREHLNDRQELQRCPR